MAFHTSLVHEGQPLAPHDLWTAWSFEPAVIVCLLLSGWLYFRGVRALWRNAGGPRGIQHRQAVSFAAGWTALALALISPLHRLGEVLFSAHMGQHELLMVIAAPLLVLGRPIVPFLWALPLSWRRKAGEWAGTAPVSTGWTFLALPLVAWTLHAVAIWVWHAPALYQATLNSELVHTLQHVSFLGTALLFWWTVFHGQLGRIGRPAAVLSLFTTSVHTSLLGALLAFSTKQWYPLYAAGTTQWGLTPLEDQQLAGLIMWVPAGLAYVTAALLITGSWLSEPRSKAARAASLLLLLILVVGCGSSKQEQARKLQQQDSSWQATIQLTTELRQRGSVPAEYARQTVQAAEQELQKNQQKAERLSE
jgi:putative membrane protein